MWFHLVVCQDHEIAWDEAGEWGGAQLYREKLNEAENEEGVPQNDPRGAFSPGETGTETPSNELQMVLSFLRELACRPEMAKGASCLREACFELARGAHSRNWKQARCLRIGTGPFIATLVSGMDAGRFVLCTAQTLDAVRNAVGVHDRDTHIGSLYAPRLADFLRPDLGPFYVWIGSADFLPDDGKASAPPLRGDGVKAWAEWRAAVLPLLSKAISERGIICADDLKLPVGIILQDLIEARLSDWDPGGSI